MTTCLQINHYHDGVPNPAILDYPSLGLSAEGKRALAEIDRWRIKDEEDRRLWNEQMSDG